MKIITAIKNELTRPSVWDSGWRLVIVGAVPVIIVMAIHFVMEYFGWII